MPAATDISRAPWACEETLTAKVGFEMGEAVEDSTSELELDSSSARTKAAASRAVAPIAKRIALAC